MRAFQVGDNATWPAKIASTATALLGIRGAGKSNLARVMAEEAYASKIPVVIFDPVGNWYGIRAGKDGKPDGGLPFAIFGGRHGDVPLEAGSGQLIADTIVDTRLSCVIDMSHEDFSEGAKRRFLTVFVDRLFRRKQPETGWMLLILEEADDYAPQTAKGDMAACLGVFQKIVKRGRSRGLGVVLVTQRSAAINKDLLNMADTLVAFRTTASHDQKAVEGWIKYNSLSDAALASLSGLANGEAWVWSPHELGSFDRVRFRRMDTLDTGKTPDHLEGKLARPATLADVDVPALRERMADTIERAKAEDPKELRLQLAELKAELAKKPLMIRPGKVVEKPVLKDVQIKRLEALAVKMIAEAERHGKAIAMFWENQDEGWKAFLAALRAVANVPAPPPPRYPEKAFTTHGLHNSPLRPTNRPTNGDGTGQERMLAALAYWTRPLSRSELALLSIMSAGGGTFKTYLPQLLREGHVSVSDGLVSITEAGRKALSRPAEAVTFVSAAALQNRWRRELSAGGMKRIFDALVAAYPGWQTRTALGQASGMEATGGTFKTYFPKLARLGLVEVGRDGGVRARPELFLDLPPR